MINLRYRADSAADATTVWAVLADHASMNEWLSRVWRSRLVQAGSDGLNGVGAVRGLWSLGGPIQEEVVTFEPPNRLEYRMVRGNPLGKDLHGVVVLRERATGGTEIDWTISLRARPHQLEPILQRIAVMSTDRFATELARAAER